MHPFRTTPLSLLAGLALSLLTAIPTSRASDADLIRTVAMSHPLAPAIPFKLYLPTIDNNGTTAFYGMPAGSDQVSGIWKNVPGSSPELIAAVGDPSVGGPSGATFGSFWATPSVNNSGHVAFSGILVGGGLPSNANGRQGIWSEGRAGILQLVARSGLDAPGTNNEAQFAALGGNSVRINDLGHTAFGGSLTGPSVDDSNDQGIWWTDGLDPPLLVVRSGDPVPGTSAVFGRPSSSDFAMNDHGQIVFRSFFEGATTGSGIWSWDRSRGLELIAQGGDIVAGQWPETRFGAFGTEVGLNNKGNSAFLDATDGGKVWATSETDEFRLIASSGSPAPGVPGGANFLQLSDPIINDLDQVAIWARLSDGTIGVFSESNDGLAPVALTGEHAPGTPNGVRFSHLADWSMNSGGQVVVAGSVEGDGVTFRNDFGIWAQRPNGVLELIVREGDVIDVDDGPGEDWRTVFDLEEPFFGSGNSDGRRTAFNDRGQIAFRAIFLDGSEGVFLSDLAIVPEPMTLQLVMGVSVGAMICMRAPRRLSQFRRPSRPRRRRA